VNEERAPTAASIKIERRIEWSDTDAATKWHNTAVLRLLEAAETALLDRLGLLEDIYGRLPRVSIQARFLRPLRFREKVEVELEVDAVGETSVTYRGTNSSGGGVAAEGEIVAVLIDGDGRPQRWSEEQRKLLASSGPQAPELLSDE
jgi:2-aminobenzoate-CoA ligase